MGVNEIKKIDKPWGYELHWGITDAYVGKILFIKTGQRLSVQYHEVKDETIYIQSGRMLLHVGKDQDALEKVELGPGMAYHIPPGEIHAMESIEDCTAFEVSTPHLDDVVRLKDWYGREGTTEA